MTSALYPQSRPSVFRGAFVCPIFWSRISGRKSGHDYPVPSSPVIMLSPVCIRYIADTPGGVQQAHTVTVIVDSTIPNVYASNLMTRNRQCPGATMFPDHFTMVDRLLTYYDMATVDDMADGLSWYPSAHDYARDLGSRFGVSVNVAAGVIAVLSPQTEWGYNKRWARDVIAAHKLTGSTQIGGGLSNSLRRAQRILDDGTADVERFKGTMKVNRFWNNLIGRSHFATIDRHMLRVLFDSEAPDVDKLTDKRYLLAENAHRDAALHANVPVSTLQAVCWCVSKRVFSGAERISAETPV